MFDFYISDTVQWKKERKEVSKHVTSLYENP